MGLLRDFFRDNLIFQPKKLNADYNYQFDIPFHEINISLSEEKNISIVQFTVSENLKKGVVLYFHGNRGNIIHYARQAEHFTRNGFETWMIDYPGYGKSTGKRSEQIIYDDAMRLYEMANSRFDPTQIILYGRSLGSGVAAQLASLRNARLLILETPYYSMRKLVTRYGAIFPGVFFKKYEFPTFRFLENVKGPITIFHGTDDWVVPYQHARMLKKKFSHIELITIKKGKHNNLAEFQEFRDKIDSLLR